jgi:hypothetical protein
MDASFVQTIPKIRESVSRSLRPKQKIVEDWVPVVPRKKWDHLAEPKIKESEGWSLSEINPAAALEHLPSLHLKKGWKLVGYQFKSGNNGNGVVCAIPETSAFDLSSCLAQNKEVVPGVVLAIPSPPDCADSFMDAIESDGSLKAYLQASILFREFNEFGATWHGCSWSTHTILLADPWNRKLKPKDREEITDQIHWKFEMDRPDCWEPSVKRQGEAVTVSFFTFSALGSEAIYLHRDRYASPSMIPEAEEEQIIATGRGGFIF